MKVSFMWWFGVTVLLCLILLAASSDNENISFRKRKNPARMRVHPPVTLNTQNSEWVVINNGIITVNLSNPEGYIVGISYPGIDNVFDTSNELSDRGYMDVVWRQTGERSGFQRIWGTKFSIIQSNENIVEVSFVKTWTPSLNGSIVPMNIDKRYILRRGDSGFYTYVICERPAGFPAATVDQIRLVFKLNEERFHYMAVSDTIQRLMPTAKDRRVGQALEYPEAVLLTNPSDPKFKGQVDDKYLYSEENQNSLVHGWITTDSEKPVGFWMITPSNEFRNGGPIKGDLTSHCGPITLNMFVSTHYGGKQTELTFEEGEPYTKVFGPVFNYLNTGPNKTPFKTLWSDAVQQLSRESASWPYDFPQSKDFVPSNQRGTVAGQLQVQDGGGRPQSAINAYIGLALPGEAGSWQQEGKGYQFWTRTDKSGHFVIKNVIPGVYNLYGWVPGFIGDFLYEHQITIKPGTKMNLDSIVYYPPRTGCTLWEIGIPDRSAAEYFIPDPPIERGKNLEVTDGGDRWRHYGLWLRYTELFPKYDLVFTVGVSDYKKDWFYAQVTRIGGPKTFLPTTWQVKFDLQNVLAGNYTLQLALASSTGARLQVRFNNPNANPPLFICGPLGDDNAIARHGIHGLHNLFSIDVPSNSLVKGRNTLYLLQSNALSPFEGVLYDYIRLESPPTRAT